MIGAISSTKSVVALASQVEPLLVAVIALLGLVIAGLAAMAVLLRRRARTAPVPPPEPPRAPLPRPVAASSPPSRPARLRPAMVRGGGGGGLAVATSSAMVCPTCRTEYHGMTYCTRDARRLVPPEDMLGGVGLASLRSPRGGRGAGDPVATRSAGLVCMACRRAYEPGLRSCPHDGNELVPFSAYNALRPRRAKTSEPAGVIARICPVCASKFDLTARFCGHDAGELVVIN